MKWNSVHSGLRLLTTVAVLVGLAACGKFYEKAEKPPNEFMLPAGTEIEVTPVENLSGEPLMVGKEFAGVLETPLYYKRDEVDSEGKTFTRKTLIAAQGTPVYGVVVSKAEPVEGKKEPTGKGLKLTKLTLHGGMSFDVKTEPVFEYAKQEGVQEKVSKADKQSVLKFALAEPADVALVIKMREKEEAEKKAVEEKPAVPPTEPIPPIS